ncbi:MAG: Rrf2 family transcriptional regulator [Planctomycetes bacterium]|nr:Rrf2 family transcriptional regulator [Planctomycetota bacterium]
MFSQASEYALRALTVLAQNEDHQWMLAQDLAGCLGVRVHYLAKVLQTLARKGILESQRGRAGGFRLARKPEAITLWEIVLELDDVRRLEGCVMGEDVCADETACPLHTLWKEIRTRFKDKLQGTTLLNLAQFPRALTGASACQCADRLLPGHALICKEAAAAAEESRANDAGDR